MVRYFTLLQAGVLEVKAQLSATVLEMDDAEFRRRHATLDGQLAFCQTLLNVSNGADVTSPIPDSSDQ